MVFDTHVHTAMSPDSTMHPREAVERLAKDGMGVIFTEHIDYVVPDGDGFNPLAQDAPKVLNDFAADLTVYPMNYFPYRSDSVLLGLELGLTSAFLKKNEQTADQGAFDFIIGSVHFVDGWDVYTDYCRQSGLDHYRRYLVYMREMVEESRFFDALGHIDYISRYSTLPEKELFYDDYAAEYDAIFTALLDTGRVLEVNTKRFGDEKALKNLYKLYQRYYALGGRYVTLGSDGHDAESLGRYFDKAIPMLRELDLKAVFYRNRERILCEA